MFLSLLSAQPFYDLAEPVVKWLTIAIVGVLVLAGVILFFAKRDIMPKYIKYALIGFVFYALVIGILMVVANIAKRTNKGYMEENYLDKEVITYVLVPLLVAMGIALLSGIVLFVLSEKKIDGKLFKILAIVSGAICGAAVLAAGVTIAVYFARHIKDGGYYDGGYGNVNQTVLYVSAAALIVAAIAGAFILGRKDKRPFDSRCIALAGICVALSFALSYITLWKMPQGGSVTLASLLPIMLFAYVYGPKKGILVCFIYGLLQAVQDPYIIHPAQFLLDYPIAFALVGFAGAFANIKALEKLPQVKFALGAVLGGLLRFFAHVLSGVFAFNAYALDNGQSNFWIYSLAYNSFVFVDLILVIVVGVLLFSSKSFNKKVVNYGTAKAHVTAEPANEISATDGTENS